MDSVGLTFCLKFIMCCCVEGMFLLLMLVFQEKLNWKLFCSHLNNASKRRQIHHVYDCAMCKNLVWSMLHIPSNMIDLHYKSPDIDYIYLCGVEISLQRDEVKIVHFTSLTFTYDTLVVALVSQARDIKTYSTASGSCGI